MSAPLQNRGRSGLALSPTASSPAKPAGLPPIVEGDWSSLIRWSRGVESHLIVREGSARNPLEKTVLKRDMEQRLAELGVIESTAGGRGGAGSGGQPLIPVLRPKPSGGRESATLALEEFSKLIFSSRLWASMKFDLRDPNRFADFPAQVRAVISEDIAAVAKQRGADIRRMELKIQSATESLAMRMEEITASLGNASAGVRELAFAYATEGRAIAATVSTVQARLDNFSGGAPGVATVEQKMTAIADRATGLEAQYTIKVQAGGAWAGIGLAATDNGAGNATSAIIMQADRIALVNAGYSGSLTSPSAEYVMFGVDSDGAYVGGNLKVTGKATFDGVHTLVGFSAAGHFNRFNGAVHGVVGYAQSNLAGAHGVIGLSPATYGLTDTSTSRGVGAYTISGQGLYAQASGSSGVAVVAENTNGTKKVRLATNAYAVYSAGGEGKHYAVDGLGPFTGFHPAVARKWADDGAPIIYTIGDIVCDVELIAALDVNNTLTRVEACTEVGQRGAMGVISEVREIADTLPYEQWWELSDLAENHVWIEANADGEGQINVCGRGGDFEQYDLVECSDMPGKGQRQADGQVRNTTVAKVRFPVTFSHPDEVKQVPCFYVSG